MGMMQVADKRSASLSLRQRGRRPIRQLSQPSTAKCDLNTYRGYLIVEPKYSGCCRLAEMFSVLSDDSINRLSLDKVIGTMLY